MIDWDKPYVLDNQITIEEWLEEQKKDGLKMTIDEYIELLKFREDAD